jgi:hypothetical protein
VTPVREAFVVPLTMITVVVLAGLQPGGRATFAGPPLFALVLATLLLVALVRSGALDPARLLHGSRPMVANANGAVVLGSLFLAAAQVFAMLTPRNGLPLFFVDVFLLVLLLNTIVARPDRVHLLRSLAVIFGSALILKFVVLAALSEPSASRTSRVLIALFDVATFGAMAQEPEPAAGGYLAFVATVLFLTAIALLPPRPRRAELEAALPMHHLEA